MFSFATTPSRLGNGQYITNESDFSTLESGRQVELTPYPYCKCDLLYETKGKKSID